MRKPKNRPELEAVALSSVNVFTLSYILFTAGPVLVLIAQFGSFTMKLFRIIKEDPRLTGEVLSESELSTIRWSRGCEVSYINPGLDAKHLH